VVHHFVQSQVPPYSNAAQLLACGSRGQKGWNLTGASRNVEEILSDEKPSDTWRNGELRFYFMLAVPDEFILIIWALNKVFTRYLKGSAGQQVTRNVLGLISEKW
jgi:hypothetical protein